ncbi:MAG TPA: ABC transporter substrate-binding protein [Gaiellaceae bacterium]|jgi:ABC-type oligopeptide transport system substrate-binding subunit
MHKKVWLSGAMAALGAAMLLAAAFAGPASSKSNRPSASAQKKGGTMNINMSGTDVDYIDPTLAYGTISWQILDSVCVKLLYYPDKPGAAGSKLSPDGAVGFPSVSKDGKTYVFTVKSGIKSNTGETLTAANYAAAINRILNPKMQSPAVPFITGTSGIVGAQAVADGKAATASGVVAKGQKLTIRLLQPDGSLLPKLAMNFFCPLPKGTPVNPDGINSFSSFGPYYVASRQVGRQIITKTNPNYKGSRPHNISTFVFTANTNLDQSLLQVKAGQADYDAGGLPATANAQLAQQFGINKGRYFLNGGLNVDYIALNMTRPAFSNVTMRKAANYAVDRPALVRVRGYLAGKRGDQILPPGIAGYKPVNAYPIKGSNYPRAKQLASQAGGCKDVTVYTGNTATGQNLAQVFKYNLSQMGCNVNVKLFAGFQIYIAAGTKGEPFDAVFAGWFADYADPYDFIDILLNGDNIHEANNNNLAYFSNAGVQKAMKVANSLTGDKRAAAYSALDKNITTNFAPWAAYENRNTREFISARIGGYLFQPCHGQADLNTFFIK